jgi:hypothetical protein
MVQKEHNCSWGEFLLSNLVVKRAMEVRSEYKKANNKENDQVLEVRDGDHSRCQAP